VGSVINLVSDHFFVIPALAGMTEDQLLACLKECQASDGKAFT
jgi:hypothetical protein